MRIERADEVEEKPSAPKAIPIARPVASVRAPASVPVSADTDDAWVNMPDREYEIRFKRMMRLKELEALGMKNKPAPVAPAGESKRTGLEVVTLANKLKEEYTALNEASEILNNFSKPNPVEQVLNSEFGKGLGQVVGTIMINGVQTFVERQQMRRQQSAQQRMGGAPPALPPQQPPPQQPVVPPNTPVIQPSMQPPQPPQYSPSPEVEQPPASSLPPPAQPTGEKQMKLTLDPNDRKILEDLKGQQDSMLKITQVLASVVERIDNIEKRTAIQPASPSPIQTTATQSPAQTSGSVGETTDSDIEKLFEEDEKVDEVK